MWDRGNCLAEHASVRAGRGGGRVVVSTSSTCLRRWAAVAWGVAIVLFIMSFWSVGIAIERIYTYNQARKQSKMYAPQVAKHLQDGRLKEAIALSASKDYRYSHLAKVVLAGLQEYQFQQESGSSLNRDDVLDTVRRSIQRATALTGNDLKKGVNTLATIGSTAPFVGLLGTVVGVINAFVGIASTGSGGIARRVRRYRRSARRDRAWFVRRDSGGLVLQLPDQPPRVLQRGDGQLLVGARRLLHQEDGVTNAAISRSLSYGSSTRRQRRSQVRYQRHASRRRHAGAAHHHDDRGAPAAAGRQREAAGAANTSEKPDTQDQTVLAIDSNKRLYLNTVPVQAGDLRRKVEEVLEGKKDRIVIIKADQDVEYSAVMDAMDELRATGIEDMGLITDPRRTSTTQGGE